MSRSRLLVVVATAVVVCAARASAQRRDLDAAVRFDADAQRIAQVEALREVIASRVAADAGHVAPTTCIQFAGAIDGARAIGELRRLATKATRVTTRACPRTYATMIQRVDSSGRPIDRQPVGYIDPYRATIGRVIPWTSDLVIVYVAMDQGTESARIRCTLRRVRGQHSSRASCSAYAQHLS